ncbi:protein kinase domain-containing protein [Streptomyces spororaveus]|uniref:protein kinase domain-containing protein n=1 Tax=Streptomyces spororaveus TaxID=284039 RepID=UPI0037A12480
MGAAPPAEAVEALEQRFGRVVHGLLSDRRGSRAWKITALGATMALKANAPDGDDSRDKARELVQEDHHLRALAEAGAVHPGYRINAGAWESGRWLAVEWVDGAPLWHALAPAREDTGNTMANRALVLRVAQTWAARLAPMHAAGWAHADVQPTNTLIDPDGGAHVIDYALACGPDIACLPYRGALTHTTAPEIADAILATAADVHVQAEPPADIWGLGASLYWCWTGHRPGVYQDDTPRADKLRAVAEGKLHALRDVQPWPFPALEALIEVCLAPDPAQRPTAAEVAAWSS